MRRILEPLQRRLFLVVIRSLYTVSAHPANLQNRVTIDKVSGVIQVQAEKKDDFDITVKASNRCGAVSNTFNVIIDEEEE